MVAPRRAGVCPWAGMCPPTPQLSLPLYEEANFTAEIHATSRVVVSFPHNFVLSEKSHQASFIETVSHSLVKVFLFALVEDKIELNMPRSFSVKKYFSSKKPYYKESQLESQTAFVPESFPSAELPTQNNVSALTCHPSSPFFPSSNASPAPLSPITPVSSPSSSSGPSSSPTSSSGEEEEEDGGRTSDPPSPEVIPSIFHCSHCNKSYSSLSALTHHQASSHQLPPNGPSSQTASTPPELSQRPVFRCKHCSKEYTSSGASKMHIRSHTLPCVCPTCGKAFSRPWLLRGHIRTHTGERPFACQHCNRAFADRSNSRAHSQTHSEVKKYQCGSCSRTFSRMSSSHKHSSSGCRPSP